MWEESAVRAASSVLIAINAATMLPATPALSATRETRAPRAQSDTSSQLLLSNVLRASPSLISASSAQACLTAPSALLDLRGPPAIPAT